MTPVRTTALLAAVALASGAGGAAVYGLADGGGATATQTITTTAPATSPAAAVKSGGGLTVNQIVDRTRAGVVDIKVTQSSGGSTPDLFGGPGGNGNRNGQGSQAEGSGFVIDRQGHIATNQHVVDGATSIKVTFADGTTASAKLVGTDPSTDVAVIKVDADAGALHPLTFSDSKAVRVGDGVVAIGSPFGLEGTVTTGIVSALNRTIDAPNDFTISGAIQTDAAINHGNSGGPLLDSAGRVIGINSQIASDSGGNDGIGFAVPSNVVRSVAEQLVSGGKVSHAYLGVQLSDGNGGAAVGALRNDGPAASAGLQVGDVVTAVDGTAVGSSDALVSAVDAHKPGDKVTLKVRRGGDTRDVRVTLGTRPG
jgi:putative serine protease PepD